MSTRFRNFQPVDTDAVLDLWDKSRSAGFEPVYSLAEVLASCNEDHAIVAYEDALRRIDRVVARARKKDGPDPFGSHLRMIFAFNMEST